MRATSFFVLLAGASSALAQYETDSTTTSTSTITATVTVTLSRPHYSTAEVSTTSAISYPTYNTTTSSAGPTGGYPVYPTKNVTSIYVPASSTSKLAPTTPGAATTTSSVPQSGAGVLGMSSGLLVGAVGAAFALLA